MNTAQVNRPLTAKRTARAIAKYTAAGCIRAYRLNLAGEGAHSIALGYDLPNVTTTRAADAAIDAGRELVHGRA